MFQDKLLAWYHQEKRDLPWRQNHNPYFIWLSEIMLQQTQVATVIDYFNRFIERFPRVELLAQAEEDEVLKLWEGLGYYSRARRLVPCAKLVVETYGGVFPRTYASLIKLPGVGPYTAGAIASIAFNQRVAAVDGNVLRVYARLFNMDHDLSSHSSKKVFDDKVTATLPKDCRHFNQGLMELGARVCTPKKPKCSSCPIKSECLALANDRVLLLPVKTKKIKKKTIKMAVCKVVCQDQWMISKRKSQGLLGGLWGFASYSYELEAGHVISQGLKEDFDLEVLDFEVIKTAKHVFTHLIWEMTFFEVEVKAKTQVDLPENRWIYKEDLRSFPLPTAFKKLLD